MLREAGLIATHREGSQVRHALTPLGAALLNGTTVAPATSEGGS
ncbi:hypothetical protein [Actinomadura chokoriensis]